MHKPKRNMTRAYRLLMAVLWPTSCVGRPFSSRHDRGSDSSTLSWAVMMRPEFGHRLASTSPACILGVCDHSAFQAVTIQLQPE